MKRNNDVALYFSQDPVEDGIPHTSRPEGTIIKSSSPPPLHTATLCEWN